MAWQETSPVEERERFIDDHLLGLYDMTALCAIVLCHHVAAPRGSFLTLI
jgi:hypothetical protein